MYDEAYEAELEAQLNAMMDEVDQAVHRPTPRRLGFIDAELLDRTAESPPNPDLDMPPPRAAPDTSQPMDSTDYTPLSLSLHYSDNEEEELAPFVSPSKKEEEEDDESWKQPRPPSWGPMWDMPAAAEAPIVRRSLPSFLSRRKPASVVAAPAASPAFSFTTGLRSGNYDRSFLDRGAHESQEPEPSEQAKRNRAEEEKADALARTMASSKEERAEALAKEAHQDRVRTGYADVPFFRAAKQACERAKLHDQHTVWLSATTRERVWKALDAIHLGDIGGAFPPYDEDEAIEFMSCQSARFPGTRDYTDKDRSYLMHVLPGWCSPKLDGIRVRWDGIAGILYSHGSHEIRLPASVRDKMPHGEVFDGELWVHKAGERALEGDLTAASRLVALKSPTEGDWYGVRMYAFDVPRFWMFDCTQRTSILEELLSLSPAESVVVHLPHVLCRTIQDAIAQFERSVHEEGAEGIVIKGSSTLYAWMNADVAERIFTVEQRRKYIADSMRRAASHGWIKIRHTLDTEVRVLAPVKENASATGKAHWLGGGVNGSVEVSLRHSDASVRKALLVEQLDGTPRTLWNYSKLLAGGKLVRDVQIGTVLTVSYYGDRQHLTAHGIRASGRNAAKEWERLVQQKKVG